MTIILLKGGCYKISLQIPPFYEAQEQLWLDALPAATNDFYCIRTPKLHRFPNIYTL